MEEPEAPTPNGQFREGSKIVKEEKKIIEENKISIVNNNNSYILTCSRTNHDSIIFNIKLDKDLIYSYYEIEYYKKNLTKISKIFDLTENTEEAWELLMDNINKYEKDIIFEFNEKELILKLKFNFTKKKNNNWSN